MSPKCFVTKMTMTFVTAERRKEGVSMENAWILCLKKMLSRMKKIFSANEKKNREML